MPDPDFYNPLVLDLSSGIINAIETAPNPPRVLLDKNGLQISRSDYDAPVGPFVLPNLASGITWHRTEDDSISGLLANIRRTGAGENVTYLISEGQAAAGSSFLESQNRVNIRAVTPDGTKVSDVGAVAGNLNPSTFADAGGNQVTLIDSSNFSSFVRTSPGHLALVGPNNFGSFTMSVGVTTIFPSSSVIGTLVGTIPIDITPSGHFNFTVTVQQNGTQVVFNNSGVAQTVVRFTYLQVCTIP